MTNTRIRTALIWFSEVSRRSAGSATARYPSCRLRMVQSVTSTPYRWPDRGCIERTACLSATSPFTFWGRIGATGDEEIRASPSGV